LTTELWLPMRKSRRRRGTMPTMRRLHVKDGEGRS
jgi:hypothetical protein